MTDLERFFDRLVRNLVAIDRGRGCEQPMPIMDIKNSVMPYRSNRRALGLESNDEYEELLMRLVAEEGGLVVTNAAGRGGMVPAPDVEPEPGPVRHPGPGERRRDGAARGLVGILGSVPRSERQGMEAAGAVRGSDATSTRTMPPLQRQPAGQPRRQLLPGLRPQRHHDPLRQLRRGHGTRLAVLRQLRARSDRHGNRPGLGRPAS